MNQKDDPKIEDPNDAAIKRSQKVACEFEIVEKLIRLRRRQDILQSTVARALGVTQARISQIERLRGPIPLGLVAAYAKLLGAKLTLEDDDQADSAD